MYTHLLALLSLVQIERGSIGSLSSILVFKKMWALSGLGARFDEEAQME